MDDRVQELARPPGCIGHGEDRGQEVEHIDMNSLRQDLWTMGADELEILHPSRFCDKVRWIDTSVMVVDCLAKAMPIEFLMQFTGMCDIIPDPESTLKEVKKQTARAKML